MGPIRVLMVIPRYFPIFGGAENQCRSLINALHGRPRVQVVGVVTGHWDSALPTVDTLDGISIHRIGVAGEGRAASYLFYLYLFRFLVTHAAHYDVVHCHATSICGWIVGEAGRILARPSLLKLSTNGEFWQRPRAAAFGPVSVGLVRKAMARAMGRRSTIVALNREGFAEAKRGGGRVVEIKNGVDPRSFYPVDECSKRSLRAELGLGHDDVIVLFCGRFVRRKGIDILAAAYPLINQEPNRRVVLCLAGSGEFQDDAVDGVVAGLHSKFPQTVRVLPPRQPPTEYYQVADIFVSPSLREGLPNAVLEALGCGLVCVLSDIAPHVQIAEDHPPGSVILFRAGDAGSLAEHLAHAATEATRVRSRGVPRSKLLASCYDITQVADIYEQEYILMCEHTPFPPRL